MAGINGFPGFISDIVQGSTKDFVISISKDGQPVDITGAKFYVTFDTDKDISTNPKLEVTISPPTNPTEGYTAGRITGADSLAYLPLESVYYSVRYINPSGVPYVIDMGRIKVLPGISDRLS